MALTKDAVLAVWRARNVLAEAQEYSDKVEISKMLADTEEILLKILLELLRINATMSADAVIN